MIKLLHSLAIMELCLKFHVPDKAKQIVDEGALCLFKETDY